MVKLYTIKPSYLSLCAALLLESTAVAGPNCSKPLYLDDGDLHQRTKRKSNKNTIRKEKPETAWKPTVDEPDEGLEVTPASSHNHLRLDVLSPPTPNDAGQSPHLQNASGSPLGTFSLGPSADASELNPPTTDWRGRGVKSALQQCNMASIHGDSLTITVAGQEDSLSTVQATKIDQLPDEFKQVFADRLKTWRRGQYFHENRELLRSYILGIDFSGEQPGGGRPKASFSTLNFSKLLDALAPLEDENFPILYYFQQSERQLHFLFHFVGQHEADNKPKICMMPVLIDADNPLTNLQNLKFFTPAVEDEHHKLFRNTLVPDANLYDPAASAAKTLHVNTEPGVPQPIKTCALGSYYTAWQLNPEQIGSGMAELKLNPTEDGGIRALPDIADNVASTNLEQLEEKMRAEGHMVSERIKNDALYFGVRVGQILNYIDAVAQSQIPYKLFVSGGASGVGYDLLFWTICDGKSLVIALSTIPSPYIKDSILTQNFLELMSTDMSPAALKSKRAQDIRVDPDTDDIAGTVV